MKHLFIFLIAAIASSFASDVLEFDDSNFATEIQKHDVILVEFFAPWCGHCKKLAPEYEIAATKLKKNDPPISLAKVDCTANQDTCSKYGVSGYPTLKVFKGGELAQDYSGPRQADGIVSTMKKNAGPASKLLDSVESYKKFLEHFDAVVIAFSPEDSDLMKTYQKATSALRDDYKFGHVTSEEVMKEAGVESGVRLYRPKRLASIFEDQVVVIDEEPTTANLRKFLEENALGLCGQVTMDNFAKFKRPIAIAFDEKLDYIKNAKGSNYWRNRVMKFGKEFSDRVHFAVANRLEMRQLLPETGLPESDKSDKNPKPVVVIIDSDDRKFVMTELFAKDAFTAFLTSYLAGEVAPYIKSETPPESNDGGVTVVVGKTFDDIVMDETKDVLIEFYAPWCGHCKSLEPKWNELGEKLKDNEDIVIAKMDATANDSPKQFAVSGFPTIYWAPKNNKKNPPKYNGGREVDDFVKYLKEHATNKLKTEL